MQQQGTEVGQDRLARIVFRVAGIYGILILAPQYFMEKRIGHELPPPITHPESYYGFIGVALAWQVLYLLISGDPARYRSVMIVGAFAKLSFVIACVVLYIQGRLTGLIVTFSGIDLILAILFIVCYKVTADER